MAQVNRFQNEFELVIERLWVLKTDITQQTRPVFVP